MGVQLQKANIYDAIFICVGLGFVIKVKQLQEPHARGELFLKNAKIYSEKPPIEDKAFV